MKAYNLMEGYAIQKVFTLWGIVRENGRQLLARGVKPDLRVTIFFITLVTTYSVFFIYMHGRYLVWYQGKLKGGDWQGFRFFPTASFNKHLFCCCINISYLVPFTWVGHGDPRSKEFNQSNADNKPSKTHHSRSGPEAPMGLRKFHWSWFLDCPNKSLTYSGLLLDFINLNYILLLHNFCQGWEISLFYLTFSYSCKYYSIELTHLVR